MICLTAKYCAKTKILKFGTKLLDLGMLGPHFKNTIVIIEISILELQNFLHEYKCLHLGPKMPYLGVWAEI